MKRALKWAGIAVALIVVTAVAVAMIKIGPNNLIGIIRYDQREEGNLQPGQMAPNVEMVALDGSTRQQLRDWVGEKPVVLIFGSFT